MVAGFFVIFILPVLILAGIFLIFQAFDLIYPGIYISDISIWGLSRDNAVQKVDHLWNDEHVVIVTDGERDWTAAPSDFGLWVSSENAVAQAYDIGRGQDGLIEFLELLSGKTHTYEPDVIFNPQIALYELERWAAVINVEGYPTGVIYENGQWSIVPGQDDLVVDIESTLGNLSNDPGKVINEGVLWMTMLREDYEIGNTQIVLDELLPILNQPLTISAYDPIQDQEVIWTVPTDELAAMVQIVNGDQPQPQILNDPFIEYINSYLEQENSEWSIDPEEPLNGLNDSWHNAETFEITIWHKPSQIIVQPGDSLNELGITYGMPYWHILEANPSLYDTGLHAGQAITIPSRSELLPLPPVREKRIEISINDQRMRTYQGGDLLDEYIISTGVASSPTHTGVFQIQTHELNAYASVWDLYMPHFMGIYEGWPGFMNGIHGLPTLSSGNRLWADVLGSPASYGCIILGLQDAEDLYEWAENGVVVEIY